MAIQKLNYLDIPQTIRAKKASEAQSRFKAILSDPSTSAEQREFAQKQLQVVKHWIRGTLPTSPEGVADYHDVISKL